MSDIEARLQEKQTRERKDYYLVLDGEAVQEDPSPEGRVSLLPLECSHNQTERKTDTEVRYIRTPTGTTGAPPLPESRNFAEGKQRPRSEEHLERHSLNSNPPIKAPMPNVEKIPWFYHNLSRTDAESLLLQSGITEGTYLLRSSQSMSDFLTLSVRSHKFVSHSRIQWDGKEFCFGSSRFSDTETLREHFDHHPVIRIISGDTDFVSGKTLRLSHPYIQKISKPPPYDQKHCTPKAKKRWELQEEEYPKHSVSAERPEYINLQQGSHQRDTSQEFLSRREEHYENETKRLQHKLKNAVTAIHQLQRQVNQLRSELVTAKQQHPAESPLSGRGIMYLDEHLVQRREVDIQNQIGTGGWGMVTKGVFRGKTVAVKQPHDVLLSKQVVQRLEREMRIMAAVKHPNLVRFLGGVLDEQARNLQAPPLIILELLDTNLRTAYERGLVTQGNKLIIFRDIAYALHYLHEYQEPIIHRDVSSPNVLLESLSTGVWRAKLSDFGSANLACFSITIGEGAFMYSAPEMYVTSDPTSSSLQTTKVDVYSYGVVLCEVAAEKMPEPPNCHFQSLLPRVKATWRAIHDLVLSCTEKSPEKRPTMATVIENLCTISLPTP